MPNKWLSISRFIARKGGREVRTQHLSWDAGGARDFGEPVRRHAALKPSQHSRVRHAEPPGQTKGRVAADVVGKIFRHGINVRKAHAPSQAPRGENPLDSPVHAAHTVDIAAAMAAMRGRRIRPFTQSRRRNAAGQGGGMFGFFLHRRYRPGWRGAVAQAGVVAYAAIARLAARVRGIRTEWCGQVAQVRLFGLRTGRAIWVWPDQIGLLGQHAGVLAAQADAAEFFRRRKGA